MGHFGNSERMKSLSDIAGEQEQEREDAKKEFVRLLVEGAKHYRESKRQMKISKEFTIKALLISINHDLLNEFATMKTKAFNKMLIKEIEKP